MKRPPCMRYIQFVVTCGHQEGNEKDPITFVSLARFRAPEGNLQPDLAEGNGIILKEKMDCWVLLEYKMLK